MLPGPLLGRTWPKLGSIMTWCATEVANVESVALFVTGVSGKPVTVVGVLVGVATLVQKLHLV